MLIGGTYRGRLTCKLTGGEFGRPITIQRFVRACVGSAGSCLSVGLSVHETTKHETSHTHALKRRRRPLTPPPAAIRIFFRNPSAPGDWATLDASTTLTADDVGVADNERAPSLRIACDHTVWQVNGAYVCTGERD